MSIQAYLDQLNENQREAVLINDGSLLVFAGAGSGKTRVITTKIAYAIESLGVRPYQILAVTFTNKACREMQERVISMVGQDGESVMIRTFHSFGVWLLRKYGERVGLGKNFKIYDDDDSVSLLCQAFPKENKKDVAAYYKKIAVLKDKMERPNGLDDRLVTYYRTYENLLKTTGNVDFADMILKSIELLENHADVKEEVQRRFRMILVDEYQDSNKAQFLLLKQLVGKDTFICAVGDDDQSIYRFRGAEVKNILDFPKAFPGTKKVVLGMNYRCTQSILNVAKDVIGNNKTRAEKDLDAAKHGGSLPKLYYVKSGADEAAQVITILKKAHLSDSTAYSNTAILYRTNSQSREFEDRFMREGIPYHIVGSLRFYEREEIRDCIALLSLLTNPKDTVAFQRMVNKPSRKIGEVSIEKILDIAINDAEINGNVLSACEKAVMDGVIKGPAVNGIASFVDAYSKCESKFGKVDNGSFLKEILFSFGILDFYQKRDMEEKLSINKRTDNLEQLVSMLSEDQFANGQEGINSFLEFASLEPSALGNNPDSSEEGVTLITMHNTKGLEFERVFLVGMENEIFPGRLDEKTEDDIEEERRICYVAMTRAKKELYMFSASTRVRWGDFQRQSPSLFLKEIDESHIEEVDLRGNTGFAPDAFRFTPGRYSSSYVDTKRYMDSYNSSPAPKKSTPAPQTSVGKYNIRNMNSAVKLIKKPQVQEKKQVFEVGDRIKSDFYGEGVITAKRAFAGREVLDVKFDNGRTGTFASDKVAFEKI